MKSTPLTTALFVPNERLGWQYVDPGEPRPSPLLEHAPLLHEPPPPAPSAHGGGGGLLARSSKTRSPMSREQLISRAWILGLFTVVCALMAVSSPGVLVLPITLAYYMFRPWLSLMGADSAMQSWNHQRDVARRQYEREYAQWRQAIAEHDERERERISQAILWYPLAAGPGADRIDVVGGVSDGWRHLLATFGATQLAGRTPVLLLDMTEDGVGDGLAELASAAGAAVQQLELPGDGRRELDLLIELTPDEVAEVMAEAVESLRGPDDPMLRAADADVLRAVAQRLHGHVTATRLAAGVRVLQRMYDGDGGLTAEEVTALTRQVDVVGSSERVQDQLRLLRVALDLLGDTDHSGAAPSSLEGLWREGDLTVVTTTDPSSTRKDFTDRVLVRSLLRRMRASNFGGSGHVLIVAGAEHLGRASLEAVAKQARSRSVRLIYLFERLNEDVRGLLGTSSSTLVVMRLGNGADAAAAADQIGRDHSFKLSQITRQLGLTDTIGGGRTTGVSTTEGTALQAGSGRSGFSQSSNSSNSISESITESSQEMRNWSRSESFTRGTTEQRVYEFDVEPRTLQTLPAGAFILVEGGEDRARTTVADCNPGIALLDRVADGPQSKFPTATAR